MKDFIKQQNPANLFRFRLNVDKFFSVLQLWFNFWGRLFSEPYRQSDGTYYVFTTTTFSALCHVAATKKSITTATNELFLKVPWIEDDVTAETEFSSAWGEERKK